MVNYFRTSEKDGDSLIVNKDAICLIKRTPDMQNAIIVFSGGYEVILDMTHKELLEILNFV